MMYPKPKKRKGNKHRHITNKRFKEWTKCHLCYCGASSKHEIFHNGSAYMRNMSIEYGAQIPLCRRCHELVHKNNELDTRLKKKFQIKLMKKFNWTIEDFRNVFYKNYL